MYMYAFIVCISSTTILSCNREFIFTITAELSSVSKLSEEEKILLVDSWKQLEQDADKIGR